MSRKLVIIHQLLISWPFSHQWQLCLSHFFSNIELLNKVFLFAKITNLLISVVQRVVKKSLIGMYVRNSASN